MMSRRKERRQTDGRIDKWGKDNKENEHTNVIDKEKRERYTVHAVLLAFLVESVEIPRDDLWGLAGQTMGTSVLKLDRRRRISGRCGE